MVRFTEAGKPEILGTSTIKAILTTADLAGLGLRLRRPRGRQGRFSFLHDRFDIILHANPYIFRAPGSGFRGQEQLILGLEIASISMGITISIFICYFEVSVYY